MRIKGTVIGHSLLVEGPTRITIDASGAMGHQLTFDVTATTAINLFPTGTVVNLYMAQAGSASTNIEGAVTIIPANTES